jgi:DNA-binding NarL/FixJ family response regulator
VLLFRSVTDDRLRAAAQCGAVGFVEQDADPASIGRAIVAAARGDALVSAEIIGAFTGSVSFSPAEDSLTAREQEVRALVEEGLPDKQIAARLDISVKTVEKHVGSILRKTHAANRTALARRSGLRAAAAPHAVDRHVDVEGIPT